MGIILMKANGLVNLKSTKNVCMLGIYFYPIYETFFLICIL